MTSVRKKTIVCPVAFGVGKHETALELEAGGILEPEKWGIDVRFYGYK